MARPRTDPEIRFRRFTQRSENGCLEWTSTLSRDGYGKFYMPEAGQVPAHRFAYELANGKIPEGKFVCHRCDNRKCVDPSHLFIGEARDNVVDMHSKGRGWGRRKLRDDDVSEVQKLLAAGVTQEDIAKQFNVDQTTISRVKLRQRIYLSRME